MPNNNSNDLKMSKGNINSPWFQNTIKSLGMGGTQVIKDLMPATSKTLESASKLTTDTVRAIRTNKTNTAKIAQAFDSIPIVKVGKEFFKNAIEDVKSGNIYNDERDPFGSSSDGETSFGNMDDMFIDDADQNVNIENNFINDDGSNDAATVQSIQKQTEYQLESSRTTVDAMVSIASTNLIKTNELGNQILSQLNNINSNLAGLLEFNKTNINKFIEASIGFYDQSKQNMDEQNENPEEARIKSDQLFDSDGGFDLSNYKEYVKGNIKALKNDSMLGTMLSMITENAGAFVANPLGMVLTGTMKMALPGIVKNTMERVDRVVADFIPSMLERLGNMGQTGTGVGSTLTRYVGKVFGIKTERQEDFDLSGKILNKPMQYNGYANHSIIEIIPKYLRESNTYLKEIALALTGESEDSLNKKHVGFNWETGEFTDIEKLRSGAYDQILSEVSNTFQKSEFGKSFASMEELLTDEQDRRDYGLALNQFYNAIEKHNGIIDYSKEDQIDELLSNVGYSDSIKNLIRAKLEHMVEINDPNLLNAHRTKQEASRKRNAMLKDLQEEAQQKGLYQIFDGRNLDQYQADKLQESVDSQTSNISATISEGVTHTTENTTKANIPTMIQTIIDILNRGIYVQLKSNLGIENSSTFSQTPQIDGATTQEHQTPVQVQSLDYFRNLYALANNQAEDISEEDIINQLTSPDGPTPQLSQSAALSLRDVNDHAVSMTFGRVLTGIMTGNADKAFDEFVNAIGESFKKAGNFVSEHFFNPIKKTLFGEKDEDGYIRNGLFAGLNNRMKESFYSFRHMITGKGYIDSDGYIIPDATGEDLDNTVVGKVKNVLGEIKEGISVRLFGEKDEDGEITKEGIIGKAKTGLSEATSSFMEGVFGWKKALFGAKDDEDPEESAKRTLSEVTNKAWDALPSGIVGAIGGASVGALSGGLLGSLVTGPVGAMVGFTGGILSKSERFQNFLFGEEVDGERMGGLISKNVQNYVKENKKLLTGGAAIGLASGAIKSAVFGSSGGILGTLFGGPIAGAILGIGSTMLVKSKMWQDFIFGNAETGQLGLKQNFSKWFGGLGRNKEGDADTKRLLGMAGIGTTTGAVVGGILGGPLLGAAVGLGASILAQKNNFKEWLFGTTDEDGNRKEGILGKFKNMLTTNVFHPLSNKFKDIADDFGSFLKYDVLGKFNLILEPLGDMIFGSVRSLAHSSTEMVGKIGGYIKDNFLDGLVETTQKILTPITDAARLTAGAVYKMGKIVVTAPINMLYAITSPIATAVSKTAITLTKTAFKAVDIALVKPLNALVIKPLGGMVKIAGKVIAAPFQLVTNTLESVNYHIQKGMAHVSNFFYEVGQGIKGAILNSPPVKFLKNTWKNTKEFGARVKDTLVEFVSPVTDLVKSAINEVKNGIKRQITRFFNRALHLMNPITWAKGIFNLGKKGLSLFGIGKDKADNEQNNSNGILSKLSDIWKRTGEIGYRRDRSNTIVTDENGNVIDSKVSNRKRRQFLKEDKEQAKLDNRTKKRERDLRNKNEKLISKYTKNQRSMDTAENRQIAEHEARRLGKTINWKNVDTVKTAEEIKREKQEEQQTNFQGNIDKNVAKIADFLFGRKKGGNEPDHRTGEGLQRLGSRQAERDQTRDESIYQLGQEESGVNNKFKINALKRGRSTAREKESEKRQQVFSDNFEHYGLLKGTLMNLNYFKGKSKRNHQINQDPIPQHAKGTSGAKAGLAIVGEKGPEVVYGKDSDFGRFVGIDGPEVIKMDGGETVIPNNKIEKYEDGVENNLIKKNSVSEALLKQLAKLTNTLNNFGETIKGKFNRNSQDASLPVPSDGLKRAMEMSKEKLQEKSRKAQEEVSTLTGERLHAMRLEEKREEDARLKEEEKVSSLQDINQSGKDHYFEWSSIFGKKGLITAGILSLLPFILKFFKTFSWDTLLNVLNNGLKTVTDVVKDTAENAWEQYTWTDENNAREDGDTPQERVNDNLTDLPTNPLALDDDGSATHQTSGRFKFLRNILLKSTDLGRTILKNGRNILKDTAKGGLKNLKKGANAVLNTILHPIESTKSFKNTISNLLPNKSTPQMSEGLQRYLQSVDTRRVMDADTIDTLTQATINNNPLDDLVLDNHNTYRSLVMETGDSASNLANAVGRNVDEVGEGLTNSVFRNVNDVGATLARNADDVGEGLANSVFRNTDDVMQSVVRNGGDIVETVAGNNKGGKLLAKTCELFKNFVMSVCDKLSNKIPGLKYAPFASLVTKVISCATKYFPKISGKLTALFTSKAAESVGAVLSAGLTVISTKTFDAIDGFTGTAKLFHVSKDKVDNMMRLISSVFGVFSGTIPGAVVQILSDLSFDVLGIDFMSSFAVGIYNSATSETEAKALEVAQEELKNDYLSYQSDEIEKQYETQKASGIISENVTLEEFTQGVEDGQYSVEYDSFADYNMDQNASLSDKMMNGLGKGVNAVTNGVKTVTGFLFGKTDEYYEGEDGTKFQKVKDGSYHAFDKDGNDLGQVSQEAIEQSGASLISDRKDGVVDKITKHYSSVAEDFKDQTLAGKATSIISSVLVGPTLATKFGNAVDWLFKGKQVKYFKTDGSYYDEQGNHYNAGDELLGDKLTPEEVAALTASGNLEPMEYETKPSGIKEALGNVGNKIKSGWLKGCDGLNKVCESFGEKANNWLNWLLTGKESKPTYDSSKVYYNQDGSFYRSDGKHFSAVGDYLGDDITSEDLEILRSTGMVTEGDIPPESEIGKKMAETAMLAGDKWEESASLGSRIWSTISPALGPIAKVATDGINWISKYFNARKRQEGSNQVWYDTDGNFYRISGSTYNKYNMNGDLLEEGIEKTKVQELASAGLLTLGTYEGDGEAQSAIKKIKGAVKDAWRAAKETATGAWDKFTSWLTGGAGDKRTTTTINEQTRKTRVDVISTVGGSGFNTERIINNNFIPNITGGRGELSSSQPKTLNGSTYYSQNDSKWASKKFVQSDGTDDGATIGDTGCGPASMAMVISDMTGQKTDPMELAAFAQFSGTRDDSGTNYNFIDTAAYSYGLNSTMGTHPSSKFIKDSLDNSPMVLLGQDDGTNSSPFTTSGHYVVATGKDSAGNVIINDPRGANYSRRINADKLANYTGMAWSFSKDLGGFGDKTPRKGTINIIGGRGANEWLAVVQAVKKAVASQKPGYSKSKHINITIDGVTKDIRCDCSGLVTACLKYYGVLADNINLSTSVMIDKKSVMNQTGFTYIKFENFNKCKEGDILVKSGHTEIYAGKMDGRHFVYNNGDTKTVNSEHASGVSESSYTTIWRPGKAGKKCVKVPAYSSMSFDVNSDNALENDKNAQVSDNSGYTTGGDRLLQVMTHMGKFAGNLFNAAMTGDYSKKWSEVFPDSEPSENMVDNPEITKEDATIKDDKENKDRNANADGLPTELIKGGGSGEVNGFFTGEGDQDSYNNFAMYAQGDSRWKNKKYASSTLGPSGCGPTSLAMVTTSLTGQKYYPTEMADFSMSNGGVTSGGATNWSLFGKAANHYGFDFSEGSISKTKVLDALKDGKAIIARGKHANTESSPFTSDGHFVVVHGASSDGSKLLVNDPRGRNWSKYYNTENVVGNGGTNMFTFKNTGKSHPTPKQGSEPFGSSGKTNSNVFTDSTGTIDSTTGENVSEDQTITVSTKEGSKDGFFSRMSSMFSKFGNILYDAVLGGDFNIDWENVFDDSTTTTSSYTVPGENNNSSNDNTDDYVSTTGDGMFEGISIRTTDLKKIPKLSENQVSTIIKKKWLPFEWTDENGVKRGTILKASDAKGIVKAQDETNVSAIVPLAIGAHEGAYGASNLAHKKGNIWGWNATNSNTFNNAKTFGSNAYASFKAYMADNFLPLYYEKRGEKTIQDIGTGAHSGKGYAYLDDEVTIDKRWPKQITQAANAQLKVIGQYGGSGEGIKKHKSKSSQFRHLTGKGGNNTTKQEIPKTQTKSEPIQANIKARRYASDVKPITDNKSEKIARQVNPNTNKSFGSTKTLTVNNTKYSIDTTNLEVLMARVVELLSDISGDTNNLSMLREIKSKLSNSTGANMNIITNNSSSAQKPITKASSSNSSNTQMSKNESIARRIAFGN